MIKAILRTIVNNQRIKYLLLLILGQIQLLPVGLSAQSFVHGVEVIIWLNAQLVISISFDKIDIEVFTKREITIVEYNIQLIIGVIHIDTRMPIFGPNLCAWCASQQIDFGIWAQQCLSK